jgi:hypothetical protein
LTKKLSWALYDKKHLDKLIDNIVTMIDELELCLRKSLDKSADCLVDWLQISTLKTPEPIFSLS